MYLLLTSKANAFTRVFNMYHGLNLEVLKAKIYRTCLMFSFRFSNVLYIVEYIKRSKKIIIKTLFI